MEYLLVGSTSCVKAVLLNILKQYIYFLFTEVQANNERKKLETALLGKRAQFQCNVQSQDASEVTLWWQFQGKNLTQSLDDNHHR